MDLLLQTTKVIKPREIKKCGIAYVVDKSNFPALDGITCYALEMWDESMRVPHWHPNAAELGYVVSGEIEIIIWRSPGETAMYKLSAGMCWFIPQAALHSLNSISKEKAVLAVGFAASIPLDIDLPVAFNGVPVVIRDAYTSPHAELRKWKGTNNNPLLGNCPVDKAVTEVMTGSPYGFDLAAVPPLFNDPNMGSVVWGVQSNWSILQNISVLRARLKPNIARDPIWYPDTATLYVVTKGTAQFQITIAGAEPMEFYAGVFDYVFVPVGTLHTFMNTSAEELEVIALFPNANPAPEVSLSVSTAFFPNFIRQAAMTQYGGENREGDPLQHLNYTKVSPYLLRIK